MEVSNGVKFSSIDDEIVVELNRFVHYLAGKHANDKNVMMEYDEIVGELFLELVKGLRAYPDLPLSQLKAVIRRMMDNRISELKYRFYVTHRNAENGKISLDVVVSVGTNVNEIDPNRKDYFEGVYVEELVEGDPDVANTYESEDRVTRTRNKLSPTAQKVFDAVIYGNNALAMIVWLSGERASHVFSSSRVKVKPWHIADALHIDEKEVKVAIREIKSAYREVIHD